jgi:transglycosylase-like protein with SLT domain
MAARYRQRIRRGVTGTTVAAAVMATVAAAQGPQPPAPHKAAPLSLTATGGTSFYTDVPPPLPPEKGAAQRAAAGKAAPPGAGVADIPATVFAAYRAAEAAIARGEPGCHLPWQLLAAIGKVESVHARNGRVDAHGTASPPILGPRLNGNGFANITDTDDGAYDGDTLFDRAVGPMQFIPSTWARWGSDGNNDGRADPNNVFDAALAAGHYLCAGGRNLALPQAIDQAILSYNYSAQYLATVKSWFVYYKTGYRVVPDGSGPVPPPPDSGGSPATSPTAPPSGPGAPHAPGAPGVPGSSGSTTAPLPGTTTPIVDPGPSDAADSTPTPTPTPSDPATSDPTPSDPPPSDPPPSDPAPSDPPPSDPTPSDPPPSDPAPTETPTPDPSPSDSPSSSESPSDSPSSAPSAAESSSTTP